MAQLHKSVACLRIGGDDLVPDEITRLLGANPTHAHIKGEKESGVKTGRVWIKKSGMWRLEAAAREPEDMNGQIHEILSQTTADITVWRRIRERYEIDLFCGWFMRCSNEGVTISSQSLAELGARGIRLALDIYGGDEEAKGDDETGTEPCTPASQARSDAAG